MKEWISIKDEPEKWKNRPMKYELLFPNEKTGRVIIYGNEYEANLIYDGACLEEDIGSATHWRPIK